MEKFLITFLVMIAVTFTFVPLAGLAAGRVEKKALERFAAAKQTYKSRYATQKEVQHKSRKTKYELGVLTVSWMVCFLLAAFWHTLFFRFISFVLFFRVLYVFCFSFLPIHSLKYTGKKPPVLFRSVRLMRGVQWLDQKQNNHLIPKITYVRSSVLFFFQFTSFSVIGLSVLLLILFGVAVLVALVLKDTEILIYTAITAVVFTASWVNSVTFEEVYREAFIGKRNLEKVKGRVINQKRIIAYLLVALSTFAVWYTDLTSLFTVLKESGESSPIRKFFISTPAIIFIAFDRFFKALNDDYHAHKNEK